MSKEGEEREIVRSGAELDASKTSNQPDAKTKEAIKIAKRESLTPAARADLVTTQLINTLQEEVNRLRLVYDRQTEDLKDFISTKQKLASHESISSVRKCSVSGGLLCSGIGTILVTVFSKSDEVAFQSLTHIHMFCIGVAMTIISTVIAAIITLKS